MRDLGPIPGLGRSPGEGNSNTLQYSCQENPIDRGAWWVAVHGVTELDMTERLTHTYKLLVKCMLLRPTVYIWMGDPLLHNLQSLDGLIIKYVSSILQLAKPLCMICSGFDFSYILNQVFFFQSLKICVLYLLTWIWLPLKSVLKRKQLVSKCKQVKERTFNSMHLGLTEVNERECSNKNRKSKNSPWEHVWDETFYRGPCRKEHRGSHGLNP